MNPAAAELRVVGGGIAGLAAAWEGIGQGRAVTLLEASGRVGGLIRTSAIDLPDGASLTIDEAADAFLARVPDAVELCRELGLEDLFTEPAAERAMVWTPEGLKWFPTDTVLGVPLDIGALEASGLLDGEGLDQVRSEAGRADPALQVDTSVGALLRSRFGDQLVDRVVGPLVGGISAGDVDSMSVRACTPQLAEAAASPGSLSEHLATARASAPGGPVFHGLEGGTQLLTDALAAELEARGAQILTGHAAQRLSSADLESADHVITTPAAVASELLAEVSPSASALLARIPTASVVLVTYVFDTSRTGVREAVEPGASGFLVPRDAGLLMTAVSWGSNKWRHWNDGHHLVVRASAGHSRDAHVEEMTDDEVAGAILADLGATTGLEAEPVAVRVSRYTDGFHQYGVGHLELVERIEAALAEETGGRVVLAGAAYRGVGIPACIRQGRGAVRSLATRG